MKEKTDEKPEVNQNEKNNYKLECYQDSKAEKLL